MKSKVIILIFVFLVSMIAACGSSGSISVPTAPTIANGGAGYLTITWEAVTGAASYNIYFSTDSGVTTATGTKLEGVTSPYTHAQRIAGTTYYYIMTAVGSSGTESTASDEASGASSFAGEIDTTFGENGIATKSITELRPIRNLIGSDGSIYVFQSLEDPEDDGRCGYIYKFTSTGILDTDFATDGTLNLRLSDNAECDSMNLDSDDNIYVSGADPDDEGEDIYVRVAKFTSAGVAVDNYGTSGIVSDDGYCYDSCSGNSVYVDSDGNAYVGGKGTNETNSYATLRKFGPTGDIDTSFASSGYALKQLPEDDTSFGGREITVDSDGIFFVSGSIDANEGAASATVWKVDSNGETDESFGDDGFLQYNDSEDFDPAVLSNSVMYLGGEEISGNGFIHKYSSSDGSYVTAFADNGSYASSSFTSLAGVALIDNDRLLGVGFLVESEAVFYGKITCLGQIDGAVCDIFDGGIYSLDDVSFFTSIQIDSLGRATIAATVVGSDDSVSLRLYMFK